MTLTWGVHPVRTEDAHNFADMVQRAVRVARKEKLAAHGDRIVITAGVPFGTTGATNILRIAYA
jgi:pyruvate kinase